MQIERPAFEDAIGFALVNTEGDVGDGVFGELVPNGGDGIVDPRADGRMAVLADGIVVGTGGEKGERWVDMAEVEDVMGTDCEEGGESVHESPVGREEVRCGGCGGRRRRHMVGEAKS